MAMAAPAVGALSSLPASYSTPLTPRAKVNKLSFDPTMAGVTGPIMTAKAVPSPSVSGTINGVSVAQADGAEEQNVRSSLDGTSDNDGRMTPVPHSESTIRRARVQSPRIGILPRQPPVSASSSNGQPVTTAAHQMAPANIGLGTLQGEDQLKISLQSKDRIFVVMLSKEIEAFIARCTEGETPNDAQLVASEPAAANFAIYGGLPNVKIQSQAASVFQRMLVYKAAEWYGVKAVPGPANAIYVGVVGSIPEKSSSLKLASLVPERQTVQKKFQIMQRSQPVGSSRSSSAADGGEGGPSSRKTLEQREADYAAARERIYGAAPSEAEEVVDPPPAVRPVEDEIDPVSRYAYGADAMTAAAYEPIYASLYHTHGPDGQPLDPTGAGNGAYYVNQAVQYPGYHMLDPTMAAYAPMPTYTNGAGQAMYPQQAYDEHGNPLMLVPQQMAGYAAPMWQQQPMQAVGVMPHQPMMPPTQMGGNGWGYTQQPVNGHPPQQMIMPPITSNGPSAPLHPHPSGYGYSTYPNLQHPQPSRPQPQPHSSASSSISSHSRHSYSRPHSRGSITSTGSAASSARFGHMYPANAGYRQKGMKAGVNGLTAMGMAPERRSTRGQSPSSTTTTSSRSSRPSRPTILPPPSQHPLPRRPDWAADNVQYVPSGSQPGSNPSSISGRSLQPSPPSQASTSSNGEHLAMHSNGSQTWTSQSGPSGSSSMTSLSSHIPNAPLAATLFGHVQPDGNGESDFQRGPPPRASQSLFDPSNPSADTQASNGHQPDQSMAPVSQGIAQVDGAGMSAEDIIEAKLQALSFSTGVSIGPPKARAASYAKVVRRD